MLNEKITIVTGAASGIGLGVSKAFSEDGAIVVMTDVDGGKLKEEADKLNCAYFETDISRKENCKALVDFALEKYGKVDILINVAGVQTVSPIEDFPEDRWDFMISLMLSAPFYLTKYVWPSMKAQGWGRIININSIHGLVASEYKSAYVSAKHGLLGFTKTAGLEGGPLGITVNSICPAYVKTPLVDKQVADQAKTHGIDEDDVVSNIMLAKSSIRKLIEPSTIAELAKFLCTDAASGMTGSALTIDGGWTAG
ncbi:MAG: 3-hydroxybutyrate dehydrogenase [Oscillospiraceae bacterium]|nr:3-hydroxybutyrate dehydrogenase [Oscillospiraceae bacterium]